MAKHKQTSRPAEKLFADNQIEMFEKSYEERLQAEKNRPVECLGMTFENDEKRREYFLEKLREKLKKEKNLGTQVQLNARIKQSKDRIEEIKAEL